MADFKLSIGLEPRNKACWNFMGLIYARQGDFAESLSCFDKVITLDSRAVDAHLNAARSCQELGLVDNALQLFAKSLAILPDQPEVLTHRGWLQLKQGVL
jgi:lipoprotein NlpI